MVELPNMLHNIQRNVVEYGLVRAGVLSRLASGSCDVETVCDADRYLLSAAHYHGTQTSAVCPVCRRIELVYVHWCFGENLNAISGSARSETEILKLAKRYNEFTVHVVEVCRSCRWNHISRSYRVGRQRKQAPPKDTRILKGTAARRAKQIKL